MPVQEQLLFLDYILSNWYIRPLNGGSLQIGYTARDE